MPSPRPVEELYRMAVNEQIAALSEHIASFACSDFPQYAHTAGRVQGLREALHLLRESEQKAAQEEEV